MNSSRSGSPGFSVIFPGKKKKKKKSVKGKSKSTLSASYIHPSKRTVNKSSQPKSHSASQQRVIRRPQNRPSLNKTFESTDQEIVKPYSQNNFPEGKDPKKAPKRKSLSPARNSREEPRSFFKCRPVSGRLSFRFSIYGSRSRG